MNPKLCSNKTRIGHSAARSTGKRIELTRAERRLKVRQPKVERMQQKNVSGITLVSVGLIARQHRGLASVGGVLVHGGGAGGGGLCTDCGARTSQQFFKFTYERLSVRVSVCACLVVRASSVSVRERERGQD